MKLENENLNEPQKPQLNIGAIISDLSSNKCCENIDIDKEPFTYIERNTDIQRVGIKEKCINCGTENVVY